MDLQEAFDRGFEAVKAYVDVELKTLCDRITALPEPIPGPPGEPGSAGAKGEAGEKGERGESGDPNATLLPPELAAEVARAVRALHEAPPVVERIEPSSPPKVVRIERDADGNLVPIYDAEPQP